MGKLFGTDGIRGVVNDGLDAMLAFRVGMATAQVMTRGVDHRGHQGGCGHRDFRLPQPL